MTIRHHRSGKTRLAVGGCSKTADKPRHRPFSYRWLSRKFAPALFLAASLLIIVSFLYRGVFDTMSAVGLYCDGGIHPGNGEKWMEKVGLGADFSTNAFCDATGLVLIEGGRYRIKLTMTDDWFDKNIRTDVAGFPSDGVRLYSATPLKRWWTKNWFLPVARIGQFGNYEYAPEQQHRCGRPICQRMPGDCV